MTATPRAAFSDALGNVVTLAPIRGNGNISIKKNLFERCGGWKDENDTSNVVYSLPKFNARATVCTKSDQDPRE